MVAKITTPSSISKALNYNERKVQKGQAECIFAGNFLKEAGEMNFHEKLHRFKSLIERNTRAKTNTLHISLNFHPAEKYSKDKLAEIASAYMQKIGFGEQPFLVYEHQDAGHPHVHIVTTCIKENGKRIDTFNIGRNQSETARKEIEKHYGLVRASGRLKTGEQELQPINPQKIKYGAVESKKSITGVLRFVLDQYCFTSLAELNAVLKLYNVRAEEGSKAGKMFQNKGLVYRIIDESGNKLGVPIKASSIYFKPTLKQLEERFEKNQQKRPAYRSKLKIAIDWALAKRPSSIDELASLLKKEKITVVKRQNGAGFLYGITFIDHRTKSVFNGSAIGKQYSAAYLVQKVDSADWRKAGPQNTAGNKSIFPQTTAEANTQHLSSPLLRTSESEKVIQLLLSKEWTDPRLPFGFINKKKKRKKPRL